MSLIPVTLTNATDTYIMQSRPSENFSAGSRLRVGAGTNKIYSYVSFSRPFPLGATITSATLTLSQLGSLTGSRTVTVRRILQSWKVGTLTYNGAKTTDTVTPVALTKTGGADGQLWAFDVTTIMQQVSDGAPWYGFSVETTDTNQHSFRSSLSANQKPTLQITWTDAPQAPSTLSPSGNRATALAQPTLRFDFTDYVGNTALQAVQVQANATNAWTSPSFDSDVVLTSTPQLDLTQSFPITFPSTTTVSGSTNITTTATLPIFDQADVGSKITGTGIPANATLTAVAANGLSATLSAAATASGTITATVTETFAAMADGASMYWRVRVRDAAGVWSGWSDPAQFTRSTKGTLTITNPAASPNNFVSEVTPPITWTYTGKTQTAYQVIIVDSNGSWIHRSGKFTGTATSYTLPSGLIHDGKTYTVIVRVWDTVSRESTPGDQAWTEASRTFTYNLSSTVAVVTSFTGTDLTPVPGMQLDWVRTTAPDSFTVFRDGKHIKAGLLPVDALVSGTSYRYVDRGADPRVPHTWEVRAVVNGTTSANNPKVTKTISPVGIWLTDPETWTSVQLFGTDSGSWGMGEDAEVYTPVGGTKVVRITQAMRGFEGSVNGTLVAVNGSSVATATANMYALKQNAGQEYWLTLADMTIPVIIGNVVIAPTPDAEITKQVSFDFWQTGDLPFEASL